MSGRVTIMCELCEDDNRSPAAEHHSLWHDGNDTDWFKFACVLCAASSRRVDRRHYKHARALYHRLINPGTCSESDVANVRAAIEALCRLLRTRGDSPEDREDRAVLELCAQEVRGTYYERCPDPRCALGFCDCRGTGLVLRRRTDGTAVIDELDAGSVAA